MLINNLIIIFMIECGSTQETRQEYCGFKTSWGAVQVSLKLFSDFLSQEVRAGT